MSARLFSRDPVAGITKYWHYDNDTDTAVIETQQDVTELLDANKREQNSYSSLDRIGEWQRFASVPMSIYADWVVTGKIHDQAHMKRFFNDSENRHLRTRLIRI